MMSALIHDPNVTFLLFVVALMPVRRDFASRRDFSGRYWRHRTVALLLSRWFAFSQLGGPGLDGLRIRFARAGCAFTLPWSTDGRSSDLPHLWSLALLSERWTPAWAPVQSAGCVHSRCGGWSHWSLPCHRDGASATSPRHDGYRGHDWGDCGDLHGPPA